ncbi:MAG: MMPL family transporter [Pirellulales bacterium]
MTSKLVDRWIRGRWWLLAIGVVVAALSLLPAQHLAFDRSIENMFAPSDPLLVSYRRLQRTFGGNELVLAAYEDPRLLTPQGIERLAKLEARLLRVPGVKAVLSLRSPLGDEILEDRALARRYRELFTGYTHSDDYQTAAAVVMLVPERETDVPRAETVEQLRAAVAPLDSGTVAGEPVMIVDGFRFIEEDGQRLGTSSTVLLMLTIAACFRSLRWMLVPLAVVQWTLLVTRAVLVWGGVRLSMVSSMLTAIVTVVGVATVVHIIVRFREGRDRGLSPSEALRFAGLLLAGPIVWACLTDAVGFGSLLTGNVGPVRDFGLMMALGATLVIAAVALLVPGLALAGRIDVDPQRVWGEVWLGRGLGQALRTVRWRPKSIALGVLLVTAAMTAGSARLEVESDFTRNFRRGSRIVQSYQFIEQRLGGAGVWDIILPAPERLNWQYLSRVLALEERLRREVPQLTKVLSLADAVEAGAPVDLKRVPLAAVRNTMVRTSLTVMRGRMPEFYSALYGEDPQHPGEHFLRIMLRAREQQPSDQKQAMIEQVRRISREEFPEAEVTGYFVLLTRLIESIVRDQWVAFGVAATGIWLMMLIAFRSPLLALIALVPNVLPVLLVMGLMGWLGLKINMGAAMIAAVSIGLSVDSSIHYLTAFRRRRDEGASLNEALDSVQQSVGRAVSFATLALVVGFSTLCLSQFVPTIYFGVLVSLTMLGGLAGNLIVLPLLLHLTAGNRG